MHIFTVGRFRKKILPTTYQRNSLHQRLYTILNDSKNHNK